MLRNNIIKAARLFSQYAKVGLSNTTAEKSKEYFCDLIPSDLFAYGLEERIYKIKGTVGQGRTVEVPWVAVMQKSITTSTTRGIYIVYLFSADMKTLYLSLMMGCEYFKGTGKVNRIEKIAREIKDLIADDIPSGFSDFDMDLKCHGARASEYQAASIVCKSYLIDSLPADRELKQDFLCLLDTYERLKLLIGNRTVDEFYEYVIAISSGLSMGETTYTSEDIGTEVIPSEKACEDLPEEKRKIVLDDKGRKRYPRDRKKADHALRVAGYRCEVCEDHFSFNTDKKRMYVEAHHLIPLNLYDEFDSSLDVEANIVSLCPNCHRILHFGDKRTKMDTLLILYKKRINRLQKAGLSLSWDELISLIFSTRSSQLSGGK